LPIANRRYGRLKICATSFALAVAGVLCENTPARNENKTGNRRELAAALHGHAAQGLRQAHPARQFQQLCPDVCQVAQGADSRRGQADAERHGERHYDHQFRHGSASAATIMDLLSAIKPEAVLFLGKCGGLKHVAELGSLVLPIAAIRGEGASNDYYPPEVPALPAFSLQKAISTTIRDHNRDYWTGTVYTTNRRVWEHDNEFKKYLKKIRCIGIDMETATIFITGFHNEITTGALLLVSDQPMSPDGVKTAKSDEKVTQAFLDKHLRIGIDSLKQLIHGGLTVKHLRF